MGGGCCKPALYCLNARPPREQSQRTSPKEVEEQQATMAAALRGSKSALPVMLSESRRACAAVALSGGDK